MPYIITPSNSAFLAKVKNEFQKAENSLKRLQHLNEQFSLPSNNQLRYAGKHVLNAISSDDEDYQKTQLIKAYNHCQRAIYDANDAIAYTCLNAIHNFTKKYGNIVLTKTFPNWIDQRLKINKIADVINTTSIREDSDLEENTKKITEYTEELELIIRDYQLLIPDLNETVKSELKSLKTEKYMFYIGIGSLIFSVITYLIAILF